MLRKLIRLSTSTTVISLPRNWIKQQELEKGDSVNVEEVEGAIIINQQSKRKKEIQIDTSELNNKMIWFLIDGAYTSGYDIIKINTKNNKQIKLIEKITIRLPGMIINEEHKNKIILEDISSLKELNDTKLFERIFHMIGSLISEFIERLEEKDWEGLNNLKQKDYTINSYFSLFLRFISKKGYTTFRKSGEIHTYLKMLELFSDKLCELARLIAEDEKSTTQQIEFLKTIQEIYQELKKQHFKKNKSLLKLDKLILKTENKIKKSKIYNYQFKDSISLLRELEQLELNNTF